MSPRQPRPDQLPVAAPRETASAPTSAPKGGRPIKPAFLTPAQIARAAQIGCTNEEIAIIARLSHDTLVVRFRDELKYGRALRKWTIRKKQYEGAKAANGPMLVWLGKNELGQSDHSRTEEFSYELNNLTRYELERLAAGQPINKVLAGRKRPSIVDNVPYSH